MTKRDYKIAGATISFCGKTRKRVTVLRKDGTKESFRESLFFSKTHMGVIDELHRPINVTKKDHEDNNEPSPTFNSMVQAFKQKKRPVRIRNRMTGLDLVISGDGKIVSKRGNGAIRMKRHALPKRAAAPYKYTCTFETNGFQLFSSEDYAASQSFFKRITKNHIPYEEWDGYCSVIGLTHLNIKDVFNLIYEMNGKWAVTKQTGGKLRLITDDTTATLIRTLMV